MVCPEKVYEQVNTQINICKQILCKDPTAYTEKDFRQATKKEMLEPSMTVPILIDVTNEEYDRLIEHKKGNKWNYKSILQIINKHNTNILLEINTFTLDQCSIPITDNSYKKNIISIIKAVRNNTKWTIAIKKKNKKKDCYQIWFDHKNKKIYISIYYGSKLC